MYDPMEIVSEHLECVKELNAMRSQDVRFIDGMIHDTEQKLRGHPWMPCHNDFHSHNVMLRRACRNSSECLLAIDVEKSDLGDPMLDLAYLTVNLELDREPYSLECVYGASVEDRWRFRAYVPLAMAHCATRAALHGGLWA